MAHRRHLATMSRFSIHELFEALVYGDDSDIVCFKFPARVGEDKPKVVRCFKSILAKASPVFKTMFNKDWDQQVVELKDDVNFDPSVVFLKFYGLVCGIKRAWFLKIVDCIDCYFYANKYQMEDIKFELLSRILLEPDEFRLEHVKACLEMAEMYDLDDFKINFDNWDDGIGPRFRRRFGKNCFREIQKIGNEKISVIGKLLDIYDGNYMLFYHLCSKYQMNNLISQVVDYIRREPLDMSWPTDLILRVHERNRQEVQEVHAMAERIRKLIVERDDALKEITRLRVIYEEEDDDDD